jgi:hypothetical protein
MRGSRESFGGIFWLRFAALALSFAPLTSRSDQMGLSGDEAVTEATRGLIERIDAPDFFNTSPLPWVEDLVTRKRLTGNWAGSRDALAADGVTFFGDITQYYQGVAAGGKAQQFRYGGRGDYLIDFDSRKMGLWEGGASRSSWRDASGAGL